MSYADLALEKHREALRRGGDPDITLTRVEDWNVLGQSVPKVGGRSIVTGEHRYPSDIRRPGMLHGKILRPETYGAELKEIDLEEVRGWKGVTVVRDGDFVGFAAASSWEAAQARERAAQKAVWEARPHPDSEGLSDYLRRHVQAGRPRRQARGNKEEAFARAAKVARGTYEVAYIQHAPMEPRAAMAEWEGDGLTVWTGTQQPDRVRGELARAFRIGEDKVRVVVPDTGGGFGGKHTGETALEAARLARAAGRPVLVQWSREEEFQWAYFRPAGVMDLAASLDEGGGISGWEHTNLNSGASALDTPYDIPHVEVTFRACDGPLRSGSYRALASTANAFARESFMDELAYQAGADPLEFRLRHLGEGRLRNVLAAAADRFEWRGTWKAPGEDRVEGVGMACGTEKASYVATCVRVRLDRAAGTYRASHVCVAFECGAVQNPANLKAQIEGCVLQGLGAVMEEEMRFKGGKILNPRFSEYRVPRMSDTPELDIVLVDRPDLASVGAGETPIIGIAPAVANGLFNAVRERIRVLPLRSEKWRYGV
jgi:isoquinoline 1-oxidoreductase